MNIEEAQSVVAEVIEGRRRWGISYGSGAFSLSQITEALVTVADELGDQDGIAAAAVQVKQDELTKVKRQLTASKAREAKLKKKIAELEEQVGPHHD